MRGKLSQAIWFMVFQGRRAIGNPDAFPIEINLTGRWMASGLLWTSARKKRTVEHTQFQFPGGVRDCDREEARIFVIYVAQFNAVPMSVGCEPETLPVEEVLR